LIEGEQALAAAMLAIVNIGLDDLLGFFGGRLFWARRRI
jgi:hypothetical protein